MTPPRNKKLEFLHQNQEKGDMITSVLVIRRSDIGFDRCIAIKAAIVLIKTPRSVLY